jgi:hypothetical protein
LVCQSTGTVGTQDGWIKILINTGGSNVERWIALHTS